ncbi:DNA internalization-related competence protein ComEC/Rec2 [Shewanella sp. 10N.286.45.A1]|uniref:DNA internalization-related competence protein ComEC/Rec2 n=1 Tax=Shewanella sp. 10N.286.45.A1 TaxID=3229694 RepID=UPI00354AF6B2
MLWPSLPQLATLPFIIILAMVIIRHTPVLAGGLIALSWITTFNALLMSWDTSENVDTIDVKAEIISLVHSNGDWISMDIMLIDSILPHSVTRKLRLSWSKPPNVEVGQQWQLTLRLKPITSLLNQGGFNQQKYLLSKHIFAKGKVIDGQLISKSSDVRTTLIKQLKPALKQYPSQDLMLALLVGDKSLMTSERWQQLKNTGTGHLFAISGLHLSVACFWGYILSKTILYQLLANQSRRNGVIAMLVCALTAIVYAYLAGFSVSTQRALIMLLAYLSTWLCSRHSSSWERLLYALFVVLLIDPLSPLSASFWLSFMALVVILVTISTYSPAQISKHSSNEAFDEIVVQTSFTSIYSYCRRAVLQWFVPFWAIQWRLALILGLLQASFFAGTSIISVAVNLLLVPWFSFVVIPLALLSLLLFIIGLLSGVEIDFANTFWLANQTLEPALFLLDYASKLSFAWLDLSSQWIAVLLSAIAGLWFCYQFRDIYWRIALSAMLLPITLLWFQHYSNEQDQQWKVHMLDVGQGMSVVIESNGRAIVYDTGASFGTNFSYADRVVLPFLKHKGISQVDYLVISHADNDHAGGTDVVMAAFPNAQIISDTGAKGAIDCRPKAFMWQAIKLEIVAPTLATAGNNGSCVVRLSKEGNSILLTGDIEATAELALLVDKAIASQVMSAPHHGSRTSSSLDFINTVAPELVLFPAGFNNRYGFPKEDVVARYHHLGIETLTTGELGQLSVIFKHGSVDYYTYRSDFAPFWYNQVFRFGVNENPE